jgi:hypothetical protein
MLGTAGISGAQAQVVQGTGMDGVLHNDHKLYQRIHQQKARLICVFHT